MRTAKLNGYTLRISRIPRTENNVFVSLTDEEWVVHHFNMIKAEDRWIIRSPGTVPAFIVKIEEDIARLV